MKYLLLALLGLLVCLVGCGAKSSSTNVPQQTPSGSTTYDMLEWMTMRSDLSMDHHMAGTANPLYTSVSADRFFWTKTAGGYPWDIQLYDENYLYLWVTKLDLTCPPFLVQG